MWCVMWQIIAENNVTVSRTVNCFLCFRELRYLWNIPHLCPLPHLPPGTLLRMWQTVPLLPWEGQPPSNSCIIIIIIIFIIIIPKQEQSQVRQYKTGILWSTRSAGSYYLSVNINNSSLQDALSNVTCKCGVSHSGERFLMYEHLSLTPTAFLFISPWSFPCSVHEHNVIVLCGSVRATLLVSHLQSQGCVWTIADYEEMSNEFHKNCIVLESPTAPFTNRCQQVSAGVYVSTAHIFFWIMIGWWSCQDCASI